MAKNLTGRNQFEDAPSAFHQMKYSHNSSLVRKILILPFLALAFNVSLYAQTKENGELAERLKNHVALLSSDACEGRGLGTEGKLLAADYIAGQFGAIGLQPYGEDYFQHFDLKISLAMVPGMNVIGLLPGSDPALQKEYILIGAHYDHLGYRLKDGQKIIYHGADDNASGVAVVLELARYFSENPELVKRSILFVAFDAEESGLLGAKKFIRENVRFGMEEIKAMFSLDMVGMYGPYRGLSLKGISTVSGGEKLAGSLAEAHGISLRNTTGDIETHTDTWDFGEEGIPAIHAFTGTKSPYHKPEDTYDRLDYGGMESVTAFLQSLVAEMSAMPELSPSHRFTALQKPFALRFHAGPMASAGISHNNNPDDYFTPDNIFAFNAGAFFQLHLGDRLAIQPEVLYDYHGSKSAEGKFYRQSITVPLNLQVTLSSEGHGMFRVYPFAGGYFRYCFDGKNGDDALDFELYTQNEWGINLGLGADIMRFHIAYTWRRGITNISQVAVSKTYNSGHYLTVGYKLFQY